WFTTPNSIHTDCGCPESGTVMVREYTASATLVKPCLYHPPPGTVIDVVPWPAGVKLHDPDRSTDATAASLAASVVVYLCVLASAEAAGAKRSRPSAAAAPAPVVNSFRRVS